MNAIIFTAYSATTTINTAYIITTTFTTFTTFSALNFIWSVVLMSKTQQKRANKKQDIRTWPSTLLLRPSLPVMTFQLFISTIIPFLYSFNSI